MATETDVPLQTGPEHDNRIALWAIVAVVIVAIVAYAADIIYHQSKFSMQSSPANTVGDVNNEAAPNQNNAATSNSNDATAPNMVAPDQNQNNATTPNPDNMAAPNPQNNATTPNAPNTGNQ